MTDQPQPTGTITLPYQIPFPISADMKLFVEGPVTVTLSQTSPESFTVHNTSATRIIVTDSRGVILATLGPGDAYPPVVFDWILVAVVAIVLALAWWRMHHG